VRSIFKFHFFQSQRGDSLLETAIAAPVLLLLTLGIVEFGRAWYLQNELAGAAQAGAIYGSQNPTDTEGMETVAKDNAPDVSSATDVSGFSATASWGCECSTTGVASASCASAPTCSYNVVDYVLVTVSATYKPFVEWPGLPESIPLSEKIRMRGATQ